MSMTAVSPAAYPVQQYANYGPMTRPVPQVAMPPQFYYGPQSIAAPPAEKTYALQQYLPIAPKRQLAPNDETAVQQGLNRWWPKIMPGYATPLPQMLASPYKKAYLVGGVTGLIAALYIGLNQKIPEMRGFAIPAGLIAGAITGAISYFGTRQRNDNILDMMSRLPEGSTRRDMLSDPVVQADRNQAAMASGGGGFGSDLLTFALLSNAFSSGGGGYRGSRSSGRR